MLIKDKSESYISYISRRFLRLYPIYILCIFIALFLNLAGIIPQHFNGSDLFQHIILHITMLHGIIPQDVLPNASGAILNPAWSISLEWQFYLIAPLIFFIIRKNRYFGVFIVVFFCVILLKIANKYGNWDGAFLLSKIHFFLLGIFCLFIFKWVNRIRGNFKNLLVYTIPLICLIFLTFSPFIANFSILVWVLFFAMTLYSSKVHSKKSQLFSAIMNSELLQWLGKISYSIYLIHEIVIWCSIKLLRTNFENLNSNQILIYTILSTIPATLLLSNYSYKWIEKPVINFSKKIQ